MCVIALFIILRIITDRNKTTVVKWMRKAHIRNVSLMNTNTYPFGYQGYNETVRMQGSLSSFR